MRIAIEGCAHGELDRIYDSIRNLEESHSDPDFKVDLLLICGDFQAMRNQNDLECLACPPKYRSMNSFYKYYSGEKVAPILTIFIGGNHEASNYMQELHFGGWVAPRIYYLGCSGVVKVGGIRIAGLSGIYNGNHFKDGHWERPPYSAGSLRSVYHLRELEVFKMCLYHRILDAKETSQTVDIFLSHDWPQGITRFGDEPTLLQKKRFLVKEVRENTLGSPPAMYLLQLIKPDYWFSAHMHVKFPALVPHIIQPTTTIDVSDQPAAAIPSNDPNSSLAMQDERHSSAQPSSSNSAQQSSSDPVSVPQTFSNSAAVEPCTSEQVTNSCEQSQNTITPPSSSNGIQNNLGEQQQQIHNPDGRKCTTTRFLALDKCLPRRQFLQVIEIQRKDGKEENSPLDIEYDLDWLVVLKATNPLSVPSRKQVDLPSLDTYQNETLASYRVEIENRIGSSRIAEDFTATVPSHNSTCNDRSVQPTQMGNPCTDRLLGMLEIPHTGITIPYESRPDEIVTENDPNAPVVADDNEIDIDDV